MTHEPPFYLVAWLILRDEHGRVLLGRRDGTGYGQGLWGLPGGKVERGEALAVAAAREALEEVGVQVAPDALQLIGVTRYDLSSARGADFFYLATEWQGAPRPLEATSEVGWFLPEHLPPDCLPWLARVLETHLRRGEWFMEDLGGAPDP